MLSGFEFRYLTVLRLISLPFGLEQILLYQVVCKTDTDRKWILNLEWYRGPSTGSTTVPATLNGLVWGGGEVYSTAFLLLIMIFNLF